MSGQLFASPPQDGGLSPRQQFAYDLLRSRPRSDAEVGMWLHAARYAGIFKPRRVLYGWSKPCSCPDGEPCEWASSVGRAALVVLQRRKLVVRRRASGLWERLDCKYENSSQGEEIPF